MCDFVLRENRMKAEDPEDEPGFLERNPTWEDSLEPTNLNETKKEEQETEHGKLQRAFAAMANADGGVTITKHTTVAAKRWKNAYLTLKRLLVYTYTHTYIHTYTYNKKILI